MTRVVPLADVPGAQPALARIMEDAWPGWYGPGGQGDAAADLAQRAQPGLPRGWVALTEGYPVGTVALANTSFGAMPDEMPWLIGLVTAPAFRRRGVGDALIAAVETASTGPVYTTTREAMPLFTRRSWRPLRDAGEGWTVLGLRTV